MITGGVFLIIYFDFPLQQKLNKKLNILINDLWYAQIWTIFNVFLNFFFNRNKINFWIIFNMVNTNLFLKLPHLSFETDLSELDFQWKIQKD